MFRIPWDETKPLGSYSADVIDDEIRNVKTAISERIDPVFGLSWDDDDIDPKRFPGWLVSIEVPVTIANNESRVVTWDSDARPGQGYISVPDSNVVVVPDLAGLYMIGVTVSWTLVLLGTSTIVLRQNGNAVRIDRIDFPIVAGPPTVANRILTMLPVEPNDVLDVLVINTNADSDIGADGIAGNKFWGLRLGG